MSSNLLISLQITALGMGLVFAAIILLSVMMSLLTRFAAGKADSSDDSPVAPSNGTSSDSPEADPVMEMDHKAQAAAIAVAMALAELRQTQPFHEPPTASVSPWQMGMRTRQMYEKGGR